MLVEDLFARGSSSRRRDPYILFRAMILDFLAFILRCIIEVIFLELIAFIGRVVVRIAGLVMYIASFGGMRVAPSNIPLSEFNRFGYRRSGDGQIEVESTIAGGIGLVICCICLALFLHFF
ncbi:hypothetical protein ES703_60679 [subsurface metagenome]|jgi:hypothetical protein